MSVSLALAACKTTEEDEDDTHYSQTETDEQEITNGNFEFGTMETEPDEYPYTSFSGWTRAVDNSAASSRVDSGIIDTAEFSALLDTLMENEDFLDWAKHEYEIDDEELRTQAETELGENADDEAVDAKVQELLKAELEKNFKNPGTPKSGANGTKVAMLNNYPDFYENDPYRGTAQKLTSSKTISLTPDTYGKITVWVNTGDIHSANNKTEFGANIRLTNTVASVTQDEYSVSDIVTDGKWVKYELYVRANDFLDSTVKVVLGLGYGAGASGNRDDYVTGTVYFDDVAYEELDELPSSIDWSTADKPTIKRTSSSDRLPAATESVSETSYYALYDMNAPYYFDDAGNTFLFDPSVKETETNKGETANNIPSDATLGQIQLVDRGFKVTQRKNSSTATLESDAFKVAPQTYAAVTFRLSMDLDKLQRTGLTVKVYDSYPGAENNEQTTLSNLIAEEDGTYTIIVKNNFTEETAPEDRTFYLEFIFGPTNVSTTTDASLYTTGSYTVSGLSIQLGSLDEEQYTENNDNTNEKFYDFYSLLSGAADSTNIFALSAYAGHNEDYKDDSEDESYSMTTAYSDKGTILHAPAQASDYMGTYYYESDITALDKNPDAGLINSKYLDNYSISGLKEALAYDGKADESIQPLMIYNATAGAYGYVSEQFTVTASSTASVSVRVRVTGNAAAYIYLVNTAHGDGLLSPLNLSFKGDDGTDYSKDLYAKITADMMDSDGWVTVNFYVAAGKDDISYRLELWNGERVQDEESTDTAKSQGFVFFDEVSTGGTFTESNVLSSALENATIEEDYQIKYTRPLTDKEKEYNDGVTNADDKISYSAGVVWADNFLKYGSDATEQKGTFVYAIYNTVNPVASTIPSDDDSSDTTDQGAGCQSVDHSTFWLSLSSLLLGVALLAAIIMLIVKAVRRRKKARKSDAKTQYKITSRNKTNAEVKARNEKAARDKIASEAEEDVQPQEDAAEQPKEEYTYGDVLEDFSDDTTEEIADPDADESTQEEIEDVSEVTEQEEDSSDDKTE